MTFIQVHADLNHENKCSMISEAVQVIPIKFAVKTVRLKVFFFLLPVRWPCSSLKVTTSSQTWQVFNSHISGTLSYGILTWHDGRRMHDIYMVVLVSMTLTLMQGHSGSANAINQRPIISTSLKESLQLSRRQAEKQTNKQTNNTQQLVTKAGRSQCVEVESVSMPENPFSVTQDTCWNWRIASS